MLSMITLTGPAEYSKDLEEVHRQKLITFLKDVNYNLDPVRLRDIDEGDSDLFKSESEEQSIEDELSSRSFASIASIASNL